VQEALELGALLRGAEVGVVEVLAPARRVDAGRLQLRAGVGRDPHVPPRRRDDETADPFERRLVLDWALP
jgi:hypothetical protein